MTRWNNIWIYFAIIDTSYLGRFYEQYVERARDLAAVGIRVNTIAPGLIDTPIYGQGDASEAFKANLQKGVLFPQRLGFQDELASMVVEAAGKDFDVACDLHTRLDKHSSIRLARDLEHLARTAEAMVKLNLSQNFWLGAGYRQSYGMSGALGIAFSRFLRKRILSSS